MKIKYDAQLLKFMSLFETVTRTQVKDCFIDINQILVFVVQENQIGKAIGKGSANVRRIESLINRKIKIVEFNPTLVRFVQNLIFPLRAEVKVEGSEVHIIGPDSRTKGLLIGRNAQNLKNLKNTVSKYFGETEIKVV